MKKLLFLLTLLLQFINSFGQCDISKAMECGVEITYYKCNNGYKPPIGFEWMRPTKVYLVFGNDTDNSGHYLNTITYNPWNIANGDNLTQVNQLYKDKVGATSIFLGNFSNIPVGVETFDLCIDCGLGYWATVQLLDDFIPARDSRITTGRVGFPAQGFGYTCGQPTAEAALRVAWEAARKGLGKSPKAFNYDIGINAKPQDLSFYDKFRSSGSTLQYQSDYNSTDRNFGYVPVPDNVNNFIAFVKQRRKYYYDNNTNNSPMYGCNFNEGIEENGNLFTYPIFTQGIKEQSSIGNNVQKTRAVNNKRVDNSAPSVNPSNEVVNIENEMRAQNPFSGLKLTAAVLVKKALASYRLKDYKKEVQYWEAAALKGDLNAMIVAGSNYRGITRGSGPEEFKSELDYTKAKYWFTKAANKGFAEGFLWLAIMYEQGTGEEINYVKAAGFYEKAAVKGSKHAMFVLGQLYRRGGYGLEKDLNQAKKWLGKACQADGGSGNACSELEDID